MAFVILDRDGKPLADHDGKLIHIGTEEEARAWLKPGERVERYAPDWHAGHSRR